MNENEGKNLAAEKKIQKFEEELKELISEINEENSHITLGNMTMNVEIKDGKCECFLGEYNIITYKDGEVKYNMEEINQLYEEIEKSKDEDRPAPDPLESMGLPNLDDLKDYEERKQNEKQRKGANQDKKEEPEKAEEKEAPDKEEIDDIEEEEKPKDRKGGLLELNLGVLVLINPKLRECTKAYLDPSANELVFKDKFGKEKGPGEYGFHELKAEDTNFELTKMQEDGRVTRNENPTKLYIIPDQTHGFGVAIDFATHHREVNLVVKDIHEGHEDSYSVINGNLARFDSGYISTYKTSWESGIREGIFKSGGRNETNEKAKKILDNASNKTREDLQKGYAEKGNKINDDGDLKNAIADILEKDPYNEEHEEAMEIATEIVDTGKRYEEIKAERENSKRQKVSKDNKRIVKDGGFGPWDSARSLRPR